MTNVFNLLLYGKRVEAGQRKAQEQTDSAFKRYIRVAKRFLDLRLCARDRSGVRGTPMCRHWLTGPDWADFLGCVIANREYKIEFRSA